jgi:hypothetical protein
MAVIDLTTAPLPFKYRIAAHGTTWQEFKIPAGCRYTTQSFNHPHYVANEQNGDPASPETPTDGGSVGTHYMKVAAGAAYTERMPARFHARESQSIFVAADSSNTEVCLSLEEVER